MRPSPSRAAARKAAAKAAGVEGDTSKATSGPSAKSVTAKGKGDDASPVPDKAASSKTGSTTKTSTTKTSTTKTSTTKTLSSTARRRQQRTTPSSGVNLVLVVLTVLTLLAAAAVAVLIVERVTTPPRVDPELLPAAQEAYSAMYTFDYTDPEASVQATLDVLTGDLREQFEADLEAQVVPSYLEVSATTRVDNITVGLQTINDEQTEAVVIAYGTFVVKSVVSGQSGTPEGSECAVTADGAEACVQTLQLNLENVDGTWLVSAVTTITTA